MTTREDARGRTQFDATDNGTCAELASLYQGDPNAVLPGRLGLSLLALACGSPRLKGADRLEMARFLLEAGADPNRAETSHGLAPLHLLFTSAAIADPDELAECVGLLLRFGAEADAVDASGSTPLFYDVVRPGLPDAAAESIARSLVEAGADPLHANRRGQTPLAAARSLADRGRTAELLARAVPGSPDGGNGLGVSPLGVDDSRYGGFIVSSNIVAGIPARYAFREPSEIPELNGWTLYSDVDDEAYISDPANFCILGATSLARLCPQALDVFDAPYGTDLALVYEGGRFSGWWDERAGRMASVQEILRGPGA